MNCQGYIRLLAHGKEREAAQEMREGTPFGAILGRVCNHPCETSCERGPNDGAVSIRALKRYLADEYPGIAFQLPPPAAETGLSIAIIGSGPAGLMAAYELRALGHRVVVFEAESEPGGLLRYGIPSFRLPIEIVDKSVDLLTQMGVEFVTGRKIGTDLDPATLESEYKALILATGPGASAAIDLPGANLPGVLDALEFLKLAKAGQAPDLGQSIVIIGGGNTAVDAALTCRLLGKTDVKLVALEAAGQMPAFDMELKETLEAGIIIENCWGPTALIPAEDGTIEIEFSRCLTVYDDEGAFAPVLENSCGLRLAAETVILAAGQKPKIKGWSAELFDSFTGHLLVDPVTQISTVKQGLFSCYRAETDTGSVVDAMASAKEAAISADRFLRGERLYWGRDFWTKGYIKKYEADLSRVVGGPRITLDRLPVNERRLDKEVDLSISGSKARLEAERCLSCGRAFEMNQTCWSCLPCEIECPVDALEVRIPYLIR
jgi:NADPH-dependent glutamate synthase beta subunit-like oxidoreductase